MDLYDRGGYKITTEQWGRLSGLPGYKKIALTVVTDIGKPSSTRKTYRVSTVWLGIDHNFGMAGPPLIFESMAFIGDSYSESECERYATLEAAQLGHERMVLLVGEGMVKPTAEEIND